MTRSLVASLLLAVASPALAEPPPEALEAWNAMASIQSLEARFVQTRTTKLLATPLTAEGTLRFRRPDRVAWRVDKPAVSVLTMSGTRMGMAMPDLGIVQEVDLASDPDAARLVQGLMVWLGGDLEAVRATYELQWTAADEGWQVLLTPKPGPLTDLVATMRLDLAGRDVREVLITEPDGDTVHIRFSDVRHDMPLTDEQLALPGPR